LIIHGGKTFKDVFSFSDLISSPLPSAPEKSTSTCQDPIINWS